METKWNMILYIFHTQYCSQISDPRPEKKHGVGWPSIKMHLIEISFPLLTAKPIKIQPGFGALDTAGHI